MRRRKITCRRMIRRKSNDEEEKERMIRKNRGDDKEEERMRSRERTCWRRGKESA